MPFDGGSGKLRPVSRGPADPDVARARALTALITALAEKLESGDEVLAEQIDPKWGDPLEVARQRKTEARAVIRRLHDAWQQLDADNVDTLKGQRREALMSACQAGASVLRYVLREVPADARPLNAEENAVQFAIGLYTGDVEDHRVLVVTHAALVRDLVRSYARVDGARKIAEAAEDLFDAMGYPANYASVKKRAQRRRNPV